MKRFSKLIIAKVARRSLPSDFDRQASAQLAEIRLINEWASKEYPSGFEGIIEKAKSPEELAERDQQLDKFNADIIRSVINKNEDENEDSKVLMLNSLGLTRLPLSLLKDEGLQTFWRELRILILSDNHLTSLPSGLDRILVSLQTLSLKNNRLKALPPELELQPWAREMLSQQQKPTRANRLRS